MTGAWAQRGGEDLLRPEQNDSRRECNEINMLPPLRGAAACNPMRVEIAEQKCDLKEDQAGEPDRGGAAEGRKELLGGHRLHQEEKECAEEDGDAIEQAGCVHVRTQDEYGL
jgi:hypothetical protein